MISSSFDLSIAIGVVVLLPLIIWINLFNRQIGLMGYVWRQSPLLARIGIGFLALLWLATVVELAAHYGVISAATAETASIILGVPTLLLSLAIVVMSAMLLAKYLKSRRGT